MATVRTGIFGGSFNPIHNGHIALASQIVDHAGLDELWFMVSPLNPFKRAATNLLADRDRYALVSKALAGHDGMRASDYEFHLPKPSYTWNTLEHLSADYPDRQWVLVIGADNWLAFDRWAHAADILAHYEVVVYPREGCPIDASRLPSGVSLVATRLYPVSSTDVRNRVARGLDIRGLVPDCIVDDVERLYAPKQP
jgi:nicotinate-nucleotide adenylyltransferase